MSAYTEFVRSHIRSAPGATQKDKMRAVAAMWRKHKGGRGKGLAAPGMRVGGLIPGDGGCNKSPPKGWPALGNGKPPTKPNAAEIKRMMDELQRTGRRGKGVDDNLANFKAAFDLIKGVGTKGRGVSNPRSSIKQLAAKAVRQGGAVCRGGKYGKGFWDDVWSGVKTVGKKLTGTGVSARRRK